jgi:hypothetical protein
MSYERINAAVAVRGMAITIPTMATKISRRKPARIASANVRPYLRRKVPALWRTALVHGGLSL